MATQTTGKKQENVLGGKLTIEWDNDRILMRDENGKVRIIFGVLPDGTYGIVISKDGFDVLDAFSS